MRVGLTGGIASGKSTVSAMLAELGAVIIDADLLAREVVAHGTPGLAEVVDAFGPEILTATGEMDRPKVGQIVFADPEKRTLLEAIIWPRVRERSIELAAAAGEAGVVVHDIPLLVETGQAHTFDAVVVVDVPVETQIARMVDNRAMSAADAQARIDAQANRDDRRAAATHLIENTGNMEDLRHRVTQVFAELTQSGEGRSA